MSANNSIMPIKCTMPSLSGSTRFPRITSTNTKTEDVAATVAKIQALTAAGCDIIRCAVPTMEAAEALTEIKKQVNIPVVADIHFDIAADDGAGLRDTDMQRMIRLCRNQLVRLHAHHHIGGFDADDQIVIPHILDQMYFIEGALDNPLRRHTVIFFHKIFFQRSTVDADTDRNTALFCGIHHCAHTLCTSNISRCGRYSF